MKILILLCCWFSGTTVGKSDTHEDTGQVQNLVMQVTLSCLWEVLNLPRSGKKRQREDKAGTDAEGKEEGLRAAASLYNDQLLLPVATTS